MMLARTSVCFSVLILLVCSFSSETFAKQDARPKLSLEKRLKTVKDYAKGRVNGPSTLGRYYPEVSGVETNDQFIEFMTESIRTTNSEFVLACEKEVEEGLDPKETDFEKTFSETIEYHCRKDETAPYAIHRKFEVKRSKDQRFQLEVVLGMLGELGVLPGRCRAFVEQIFRRYGIDLRIEHKGFETVEEARSAERVQLVEKEPTGYRPYTLPDYRTASSRGRFSEKEETCLKYTKIIGHTLGLGNEQRSGLCPEPDFKALRRIPVSVMGLPYKDTIWEWGYYEFYPRHLFKIFEGVCPKTIEKFRG